VVPSYFRDFLGFLLHAEVKKAFSCEFTNDQLLPIRMAT
jgi:hypothetical protein